MAAIIHAAGRREASRAVAFQFDDIAAQAQAHLDQVRAEADALLAQARRDAEAVRRRAEAEGHRAGMEAVEEMVRREMAPVLPALERAVEEIGQARQAWLAHWESAAVKVASAIAARVVRRELAAQPDIPVALVREALELAAGESRVRIHLNPADLEVIRGQVRALLKDLNAGAASEVAADPTVSRGGCRVETPFGVIDQQFESQLQRIEEELNHST